MKVALSLLLLVAYAHAGPIPSDSHKSPQSVQTDKPVAIIGSSQVDAKSGGKVTIHLDQRSQLGGQEVVEPVAPVEQGQSQSAVPVVSVAKVEQQVKQPGVSVPVVKEEAKKEPVLTGRNQVTPTKPVDVEQSSKVQPVKNEILSARNQVSQPSAHVPQSAPVPVVKEEISQKAVPVVEKPAVVVEQVAVVPVVEVVPQVQVLPEVPVVVQSVVVSETVPQAIVVPEISPIIPVEPVKEQIPAEKPSLEVRSTPVQEGQPILSQSSQPVVSQSALSSQHSVQPSQDKKVQLDSRNTDVKEEVKVEIKQKPVESQARNLKVDQTPVKAPVVVSSVQKQLQAVQVVKPIEKSQSQQVSQGVKLEGKHADLPVVKTESVIPARVEPVQVQAVQIQPVPVQAVSVEPVQAQPVPVQVSVIKHESVVLPVQVKPVEAEQLPVVVKAVVPEQSVQPEVPQVAPQLVPVVKPVEPVVVEQLSSVQSAVVPTVVNRQDSVKPVVAVREEVSALSKPSQSQPQHSPVRAGQVVAEPVKALPKSN